VENEAESSWSWVEGIVNTGEDHFKITYREDPEPIALVARDEGRRFPVQFISAGRRLNRQREQIFNQVRRSLDFYLNDKGKKDPWMYAIYHCSNAPGISPDIHWKFYPKE
jgi:hypothetical protein